MTRTRVKRHKRGKSTVKSHMRSIPVNPKVPRRYDPLRSGVTGTEYHTYGGYAVEVTGGTFPMITVWRKRDNARFTLDDDETDYAFELINEYGIEDFFGWFKSEGYHRKMEKPSR